MGGLVRRAQVPNIFIYLRRVRALTSPDRSRLLQAAVLMLICWLGLHALGLARMQRIGAKVAPPRAGHESAVDPRSVASIVAIAARHSLFPVTCLTRSLALEFLLRRCNVAAQLRVGVRRIPDGLEAHAWVECNGTPVNDDSDIAQVFTPFATPSPWSPFRSR